MLIILRLQAFRGFNRLAQVKSTFQTRRENDKQAVAMDALDARRRKLKHDLEELVEALTEVTKLEKDIAELRKQTADHEKEGDTQGRTLKLNTLYSECNYFVLKLNHYTKSFGVDFEIKRKIKAHQEELEEIENKLTTRESFPVVASQQRRRFGGRSYV
jgi:DNA repair exonuclease SbcCD ATPase subunit